MGLVERLPFCCVVAIPRMENRQVEFMLDQVMHGVLEGARLKLTLVVGHHHGVLIVVVNLEARHADHSSPVLPILPKLGYQRFFLQPKRQQHARLRNGGAAAAVIVIVIVIVIVRA